MGTIQRVLGIVMVIASAIPMGMGDGLVVSGNRLKGTLATAFGYLIYWCGFLLTPKDLGLIIGVWEISAVITAYITVFSVKGLISVMLTIDFVINFLGLISGVAILAFFSHRMFGMLPGE